MFFSSLLSLLAMSAAQARIPSFGHDMLQLFQLDPKYLNLNHGSYGSTPKAIMATASSYRDQIEMNPDAFMRYQMYGDMDAVRAQMAAYISGNPSGLVFVPNASSGVNAVLRSLRPPSSGKNKILYLDTEYMMTQNTLNYISTSAGFQDALLKLHMTFPTSNEDIINTVVAGLEANKDEVYLAVFSHINSCPGIILPVKELIEACHARGIMVLVDGAHVLGHIPLNVTDLDADFYVSNGHKWLYTPKGSAILYVKEQYQSLIYPAVISEEGTGSTHLQFEFSWTGTMDYAPFLSFPNALAWRDQFGGDANIMNYIHQLAITGGNILINAWGTEKLVSDDMIGAMVNVRLPVADPSSFNAAIFEQNILSQFNTWIPAFPITINGGSPQYFTRVCAQIYNEESDYVYLANSVLALLAEMKQLA